MTFRVSEVYASVQGEGPRVGYPTVFTRFAGCNLRCPGWPCDTQHAIDPAYRKSWQKQSVDDLLEQVRSAGVSAGARFVTWTGGEPFLQPKADLQQLASRLRNANFQLEAFTNGTISYPRWAIDNIRMIMDWKLPGSGEVTMNHVRLANLEQMYMHAPNGFHSVKFVCKDMNDMTTAYDLWKAHGNKRIQVFYGRVWDSDITNAQLAEYVMKNKLGWRLNVQMHNYIWDPQERGR